MQCMYLQRSSGILASEGDKSGYGTFSGHLGQYRNHGGPEGGAHADSEETH